MMKFSVDYSDLQSKLSRKRAFRLVDVKDRIKKVAFDVVRFMDSDKIDDLWQIHRVDEDEYIVAMYNEEELKEKTASKSPWSAIPDRGGANVNVFYQGNPIKRIALASLGISSEDAYLVCRSLNEKLAEDESFFNSFVQELTAEERKALEEVNPSILAGK